MSDTPNETIVDIKSLIYRKMPPPLENELSFPNDFSLKRRNSSGSSNSFLEQDLTPQKKVKKNSFEDRDMTYIGSPREFRRMRSDLLDTRNTILTLESHIQQMHSVRKEMEILFDKERSNLRAQTKKDQKAIEELESQLQSVRKREQNLKKEMSILQNKTDKSKIEYNTRIEDLEKSYEELKYKTGRDDNNKDNEITTLKRKLDEIQMLYTHAQDECNAHKNLTEELTKKLTKENTFERKIETLEQTIQRQNMKIKEMEYELTNNQEMQQQVKTQAYKLGKYTELDRENKKLKEETTKLKEEVHNKLVLEEQVHHLENRLLLFKEREQKLATLQAEHIQTEMHLEEWRSLGRSLCEKNASDLVLARSVKQMVERLQQQEITLTSEKVQLESQISSCLHDASVAKTELEKTKNLLTGMQTIEKQKQNMIHRMQKKLALLTRERDSYRLQLDSYERDLTICMNPASSGGAVITQQHNQNERIENLERIIQEYRDLNNKLENDLHHMDPISSDSNNVRTEQIKRMKDQIDKLKADNESLRNRKDQLEVQMEQYLVCGETSAGTRVLHNAKNPIMDYLNKEENEKQKLQLEVNRLKRKIHNMEQGLEGSSLNISISPEELNRLREQSRSAELQIQKLTEYFKSSMQEFRNVVYMLIGYKIDKVNSQYKLTSMYAESENDTLYFQLNSEGSLDLLENQFSSTLEELIDLHLRHQKSIPAFLSVLMINTFNSSTMTTNMG